MKTTCKNSNIVVKMPTFSDPCRRFIRVNSCSSVVIISCCSKMLILLSSVRLNLSQVGMVGSQGIQDGNPFILNISIVFINLCNKDGFQTASRKTNNLKLKMQNCEHRPTVSTYFLKKISKQIILFNIQRKPETQSRKQVYPD